MLPKHKPIDSFRDCIPPLQGEVFYHLNYYWFVLPITITHMKTYVNIVGKMLVLFLGKDEEDVCYIFYSNYIFINMEENRYG